MKRQINIYIFLCVAASVFAVAYQPCQPSSFRSTSTYVCGAADYNQSSYTIHHTSYTTKATGSLSAISASNFAELNSEEGWCAGTSAKANIRKGRPGGGGGGGGGAIGEYDFHSPIGDTPWILFGLLLLAYGAFKWEKKSAEI